MQVTRYELRCVRTLQVKMFSSLTAEKADRLNRMLYASGSSFRFTPHVPVLPSVGRLGDGKHVKLSVAAA